MWLMTTALGALVLLLSWLYSNHRHSYWESRGLPTAPGKLPFIGHIHKLFSRKILVWKYFDEVYRNHGGSSSIVGYYVALKPTLMIGSPDLAKAICIKDFDHFVDRRSFNFDDSGDNAIFNNFLTFATGSQWKGMRSILSPNFTSGKMKGMFPLVEQKADALVYYISKQTSTDTSILLRKTFGFYSMEVIASCAFGMEAEAFTNEKSVFITKSEELFKSSILSIILAGFLLTAPKLARILKISYVTPALVYFINVIKESMKQREAGLYRGDFLDLMMEARQVQQKTSNTSKYTLTDNAIVANSVLFILAGFDTIANTLSSLAYLLGKHPEIQKQLREEMQDLLNANGEISYQGIMEAKFLDACLSESLRIYSPPSAERQCTKEYKLPGTDVVLPPNIHVTVPIYSIHHDECHWPEPEEFKPDRFMPENKVNIKSGTYLPFGIGPRNCIGMRFAQMETKLAITKILLSFEINLAPGYENLEFDGMPGQMRPSEDFRIVYSPLSAKK